MLSSVTRLPHQRILAVMGTVIGFAAAAVYAGYSPWVALFVVATVGAIVGTSVAVDRSATAKSTPHSTTGLPIAWEPGEVKITAAQLALHPGETFSKIIRPLAVPNRAAGGVPLTMGAADDERPSAQA
jgi:hypothetical protein